MAPIITTEWNEVPPNVRAGADHLMRSICKSPETHLATKDTPYKFVYRYRASQSDPNVVRFQVQILVNGKGVCLGYVTDGRVGALLVTAALLDCNLHTRDRLHGWFYAMMHDAEIRTAWVSAIGTRQLPQDLPPRIPHAAARRSRSLARSGDTGGHDPQTTPSPTGQTTLLRITFQPLDADVPENLKCPLQKTLMRNPVRWEDGNVYDEDALRDWLRGMAVHDLSFEDKSKKKHPPCWKTREMIASFRAEYYNAAKRGANAPRVARRVRKRPASSPTRKENACRNVVPKTKMVGPLEEMMKRVFEKCYTVGMFNATFNSHYGRIMSRFLSVVDMHERIKEVGGTRYPFHDSSHTEGGHALAQWIRSCFSEQIAQGHVEEIRRGACTYFSGFRPTTVSQTTDP